MSVPLNTPRRSELPLIAFTACEPAALGVALFGFLVPGAVFAPVIAWAFSTIGMLASIAHLAKPLRSPRSLTNLRMSWLSREILTVGVFWALLAGWAVALAAGGSIPALCLEAAACACGAVLMYVIARAYRVTTRPAWCGSEGLMELWACALGAGSAVVLACAGAQDPGSSALVGASGFGLYFCPGVFCPGVLGPLAAIVLCLAPLAGLALDVVSHRARRRRLVALASESDERIPLTLERYRVLWPTVRRLWAAEGAFCILIIAGAFLYTAAAGFPDFASAGTVLAVVAAAGQIVVHGMHRNIFYELPVQVRWVARLRK